MEIARLTLMTWVVIVLLVNNSLVYAEELNESATSATTLTQVKVLRLNPDGVTPVIASSGALSGNATRHFRSANVVHGFLSPKDTVTWTVNVPKDNEYVVGVLYGKREQTQLEVSSGGSVLTAPSLIRARVCRPFFWRQELPGTLHLKRGENQITFRLPDATPATELEGNRARNSRRLEWW